MAPRKGAYAEESAEVEVLFANMSKMQTLTRKIQGSLNRLDASGRTVQEAVGPILGNTQRLQTANNNIDKLIDAIDRIQAPRDQTHKEERIIQNGPRNGDLRDYIASLDRSMQTLSELKRTNLRANQDAVKNLTQLLAYGAKQLEDVFRDTLRDVSAKPIVALEFVSKGEPFPLFKENETSTLRLIHQHILGSVTQLSQGDGRSTSTQRIYAEIRGEHITNSLRTLAEATLNTSKKKIPGALYKKKDNGIEYYSKALKGLLAKEYENICLIFSRNEWGPVLAASCDGAISDFSKTLRDLNGHIQRNLMTDCFLGYEVVEVVGNLAMELESQTISEIKRAIVDTVKPIRETSKASLGKLLEDTRARVQALVALPLDGVPVPVTTETMTRLQEMTNYLAPLTSIMTSLGPGGWKEGSNNSSSTSVTTMKSFDVGADGKLIFAEYATDTIETLLQNLENKSRMLLKGKSLQGVFLANNVSIIDNMIRSSELQPILGGLAGKLENWRKKGSLMYMEAWREPSGYLLDVQYTNRSGRPHSGSASGIDSAAIVKTLASKEKDAIKEKFKNFNTSFEELVARHRAYKMERDVKSQLGREVQSILEPLYGRFWDKYHEIDKGKGKYVKYDKTALGSTLASLA